jgi:energy-coupling factor transporter ATP-binding protein EcfA2
VSAPGLSTPHGESAATFSNLTYRYPERETSVLRDLNWTVAPGEFVTVTGPSGSGKSTLLRCLNGLTPHFSGGTFDGVVTVAGYDTRHYRPRVLAKLTGFVFQNPEVQFVAGRVDDELAFGMEQLGVPPVTMRKRVEEVLDLLGMPRCELARSRPSRVENGNVWRSLPHSLCNLRFWLSTSRQVSSIRGAPKKCWRR